MAHSTKLYCQEILKGAEIERGSFFLSKIHLSEIGVSFNRCI